MANTISTATINYSGRESTTYLTLQSDGTQETATIIYDSSVIAALLASLDGVKGFADPLNSRILEIYASSNAASTARVRLLFDASTDVVAMDIPCATNATKANFRKMGGLLNKGGSGITGDILLTTTGLASGDTVTIVITVGAY